MRSSRDRNEYPETWVTDAASLRRRRPGGRSARDSWVRHRRLIARNRFKSGLAMNASPRHTARACSAMMAAATARWRWRRVVFGMTRDYSSADTAAAGEVLGCGTLLCMRL